MIKMVTGSGKDKNNYIRNKVKKLNKKGKKVLLISNVNYFDYLLTFSKSFYKRCKYINYYLTLNALSCENIIKVIKRKYENQSAIFLDIDFCIDGVFSDMGYEYILSELKPLKIKKLYITISDIDKDRKEKVLSFLNKTKTKLHVVTPVHEYTEYQISTTSDFSNVIVSDYNRNAEHGISKDRSLMQEKQP